MLALLFLTLHRNSAKGPFWRAWKSFDWDAMARLHGKRLIMDPVGKAKSVLLTDEGRQRCEAAYYRLFTKR